MGLDRSWIGKSFPTHTVEVVPSQLRFFANTIGETNPIYLEEQAAKDAGYPGILAPLTYGFSLKLAIDDPFQYYRAMGVDLQRLLHSRQKFDYAGQIFSGDRLEVTTTIVDIYDRRRGAIEFIDEETKAVNQHNELVSRQFTKLIVRNGAAAK